MQTAEYINLKSELIIHFAEYWLGRLAEWIRLLSVNNKKTKARTTWQTCFFASDNTCRLYLPTKQFSRSLAKALYRFQVFCILFSLITYKKIKGKNNRNSRSVNNLDMERKIDELPIRTGRKHGKSIHNILLLTKIYKLLYWQRRRVELWVKIEHLRYVGENSPR